MNRTFVSFPITGINDFKKLLLNWANQFDVCCFLDNHNYPFAPHSYECILAAGVHRKISVDAGSAFAQLKQFFEIEQDWIFGHLSYDLKNELEQLQSSHHDGILFPELFFFVPQAIIILNGTEISIGSIGKTAQSIFEKICNTITGGPVKQVPVKFDGRFSKEEYIETVKSLQQHILRGDCYEINFCQEFFSSSVQINPLRLYQSLSDISPNPFAAFYKIDNKYLCCASPERYLTRKGNKIMSQPIKGTWTRDPSNPEKDNLNKNELYESRKERSENVMVVDLVRNDLSKVCEEGTVSVDELYGIYSFPQVHQMISTVSGTIKTELNSVDAIKATFPMGSMTGAPKKRVMELIEHYEKTKRGLFSGAVGYLTPQADFDFNVVIRSVLFNQETNYLSYQVGSAITFYSDPEREYEECLLKAEAIVKVLS